MGAIIMHLDANAISAFGCVCQRWRALVNEESYLWNGFDLTKLFPSLKGIDGASWKKHIDVEKLQLDLNNEPNLKIRTTILAVNKLLSFAKSNDTCTISIVTIPKGLCMMTFDKLSKSPELIKEGNQPIFEPDIPGDLLEHFKDHIVEEPYRVVLRVPNQECDQAVIASGCEAANPLEILTHVVMKQVQFTQSPNDAPKPEPKPDATMSCTHNSLPILISSYPTIMISRDILSGLTGIPIGLPVSMKKI